jgi:hypothetical protein
MAEADLEKYAQIMAEGGAVDLEKLEKLLQRETALESDSAHLARRAISDYALKLLSLLPNAPRPTLGLELLKLTQMIKANSLGADLWASQNRWHQLWNDPSFANGLSPNELAIFLKVGENLGFGLAVL